MILGLINRKIWNRTHIEAWNERIDYEKTWNINVSTKYLKVILCTNKTYKIGILKINKRC